MPFEITNTTGDFDSAIYTISANDTNNNILWYLYSIINGNEVVIPQSTFVGDDAQSPIMNVNYDPSCTNGSVIWSPVPLPANGACAATSGVKIEYKTNYTYSTHISAYNQATFETDDVIINLRYITLDNKTTSTNTINIAAKYVSTSNPSTSLTLPSNWKVEWIVTPIENTHVRLNGSGAWTSNTGYISGTGPTALTFNLSSSAPTSYETDYKITGRVYDDSGKSINARVVRGTINEIFVANPRIGFRFIDTLSDAATAQATLGRDPMPTSPTPSLSWTTDPSIGNTSTNGNYFYINGGFDYTKDYQITLEEDGIYNQIYTTTLDGAKFRPWRTWTSGDTLTITSTLIGNIANVTRYLVKVVGTDQSTGDSYNLDPALALKWFQITDTSSLVFLNDGLESESAWENILYTWYGDDLYIDIVNDIVDTLPPQQITRTYRSILYDYSDTLTEMGQVDFQLTSYEYISDDIFYPDYTFMYDARDAIIYRPTQSGSTTYTIFFDNTSFPSGASNRKARLVVDGAAGSWVPIGSSSGTTSFSIPIDRTSETEKTIYFDTELTISGATFSKQSRQTTIKIVNIPDISQFRIYPEYIWNSVSQTWTQVYIEPYPSTFILLQPNPGTSIYGMCHTENFLLSASPLVDANLFVWTIDGFENDVTVLTPNKRIVVPIVSPGATTTTHHITARAFNDSITPDMPTKYFDTSEGTFFDNYYDSRLFQPLTNREPIILNGVDVQSNIFDSVRITPDNYCTVPGELNLRVTITSDPLPTSPFKFTANNITWRITKGGSDSWSYEITNNILSDRELTIKVPLSISDSGNVLTIPDFRTSSLSFELVCVGTIDINIRHPVNNLWCTQTSTGSFMTPSINAIPVSPLIYTFNRYVSPGELVKYENVSLPTVSTITKEFTWTRDTDTARYVLPTPLSSYETILNKDDVTDIVLEHFYDDTYGTRSTITQQFNNTVFVENFESFNPDIDRVRGKYTLKLPFDVRIASNDILTHDNINQCYKNVYNNLLYIIDKAKLYDTPPTSYEGWLGTMIETDGASIFRWRINAQGLSHNYTNPKESSNNPSSFNCNHMSDIVSKNDVLYIANNNPAGAEIVVTDTSFRPTRISERNVKSIDDRFNFIKSLHVTDNGRVYVLDSLDLLDVTTGSKNEVVVFDYNPQTENEWTLLQSWGGLGGKQAKYKFNNPQDLFVDKNNILSVVDTDNLCIKRYSGSGSWIETLSFAEFTKESKPISICQDSDDRYHILLNNNTVLRVDNNVVLNTYTLQFVEDDDVAVRLKPTTDGGFVYVLCKKSIIKVRNDAAVQYPFAAKTFNDASLQGYIPNYTSCAHDTHRNLLILSSKHILKYTDKLSYTSLIVNDIEKYFWELDEILIKKEEYVQDWVINKALHRLWDNIETVRRFIIGKYSYKAITNTYLTSAIAVMPPPSDFNYCEADWLPKQEINFSTVKICNVIPVIRTFTPDEYKLPPYTKDEIYLGINEFVTSDVLNRCLIQLYEFLETLIDMISDSDIDRDNLCDTETGGVERVSNSVGACCLPNGTCRVLTRLECETLNGIFQGPCIGCNGERL